MLALRQQRDRPAREQARGGVLGIAKLRRRRPAGEDRAAEGQRGQELAVTAANKRRIEERAQGGRGPAAAAVADRSASPVDWARDVLAREMLCHGGQEDSHETCEKLGECTGADPKDNATAAMRREEMLCVDKLHA
ncbi:hypothetical protein Scep_029596 [Stephania cephalantha]|uniref:Uncharacterized protein n=1 Tax=Stephania cephalantha TaxID=152367 RepID=A0AAP0DXZ7_9MAGN